jgi:DNA repair exonuclease SbcCD ATPase subunit
VLYLAEVQKKSGVFGGGKAELKLLACQRADSWSATPNEEIISAEEANSLNPGVLVLVDLTANKQVQRLRQDTAGELLKILQSFSRQIEKYKKESDEIDQWKESLIFQSEELQRREEETQAQLEKLDRIEAESEQLAQERQEMDSVRSEAAKLKEELDKNRQELDAAWEQLRQEQAQFQETGKLDEGQVQHLQELIDYLSGTTISIESERTVESGV